MTHPSGRVELLKCALRFREASVVKDCGTVIKPDEIGDISDVAALLTVNPFGGKHRPLLSRGAAAYRQNNTDAREQTQSQTSSQDHEGQPP